MSAQSPEELPEMIAAAFNGGGLDAMLALYEPEAVLVMPHGGERVRGVESIRTKAGPLFAEVSAAKIDLVGKVQTDGIAMTHSDWTLMGTDDDGNAVETTGRGTVVSRRQSDGNWLIVFDNPLNA